LNEQEQNISIKKVIKDGFFTRSTRYSTLAAMALTMLSQLGGQVFLDNYSTLVFNRMFFPGVGQEINFYDGIVILSATFLCMFTLDSLGRKTIFLAGGLGQIVFIWGITFSLYMKYDKLTVLFAACYTFCSNFASSVMFVYLVEICEPFVVGVAIAMLWLTRSMVNIFLPYTFNWSEIYWSPCTMCITSLVFYI